MPSLVQSALNDALNGIDISSVSLHTAYSSGGDFEVVSLGYMRMPVSLFTQTGTPAAVRRSGPAEFVVAPGLIVSWLGLWDAANGFQGMLPIGGFQSNLFSLLDSDRSTFVVPGHTFVTGDQVVPWHFANQPSVFGLNEGQIYSVIIVDTNRIHLALSALGAPITFVTFGVGELQLIAPTQIGADGTFTLIDLQLYVS